jgi:hypothetical protein
MTEWQRLGEITPSVFKDQPVSWFKYVPHENVSEYLLKGWEVADSLNGTNHGFFAVLMKWAGEGEPK